VSDALRIEGWSVQPSFAPHAPTSPVTLLLDDAHLTQLAGEPNVAWQTPWEEVRKLELRTLRRRTVLRATIGDVTYQWTASNVLQIDDLDAFVANHGGLRMRPRRRFGALVVVLAVLLASLGGLIGSIVNSSSSAPSSELATVRAINLTLKDLPAGYSALSGAALSDLVAPSSEVFTSTTTTTPPPSAAERLFKKVVAGFESCIGVSYAKDREYGSAGQAPDFQDSSPVFGSRAFGGIEIATTTQYYATTTMVQKDTQEFKNPKFASCLVASSADQLYAVVNTSDVTKKVATTTWVPVTFATGFRRAAVATLSLPSNATPLHLVAVQASAGHIEETLLALVVQWPTSSKFVDGIVNTVLARMSSSGASRAV
jgi:hypothetical protein